MFSSVQQTQSIHLQGSHQKASQPIVPRMLLKRTQQKATTPPPSRLLLKILPLRLQKKPRHRKRLVRIPKTERTSMISPRVALSSQRFPVVHPLSTGSSLLSSTLPILPQFTVLSLQMDTWQWLEEACQCSPWIRPNTTHTQWEGMRLSNINST